MPSLIDMKCRIFSPRHDRFRYGRPTKSAIQACLLRVPYRYQQYTLSSTNIYSVPTLVAMVLKPLSLTTNLLRYPPALRLSLAVHTRPFSVLNRPPPNYEGHVPLTTLERGALAIGSAIGSLINPRRGGTHHPHPLPQPPPPFHLSSH